MSKSAARPVIVPFEPIPQLTRAVVGKKEIRFELQVPDEVGVSEFALKLQRSFKHEFRTNKTGYYGDDPCPVTVESDPQDKSKVIATYSLEGWTPKFSLISDCLDAKHAFKAAGVRMGYFDTDRKEMDERIEDAISDAFDALDEMSKGEPKSHVATELYRRQLKRKIHRG